MGHGNVGPFVHNHDTINRCQPVKGSGPEAPSNLSARTVCCMAFIAKGD